MSAPAVQPIIIFKKKKGHAGHHGGAWKVAYADFVTAMMALFIVLWLLSASQDVKKSIAGYFRDPKGSGKQTGSSMGGTGESLTITKDNMDVLKSKLEEAVKKNPQFEKMKDYVQMTVTGEGLRIELLESEKGMFFATGQAVPTELGRTLLTKIAQELGKTKNLILVEGHTDSQKYKSETYSNWELSADRANTARQIMRDNGLGPNQVSQVRGFADADLHLPDKPEDASNRRVSIIVQNPTTPEPEASPSKDAKAGEEGGEAAAESKAETHGVGTPPKEGHGEAPKAAPAKAPDKAAPKK
jgi:chemotaxis protein MotB